MKRFSIEVFADGRTITIDNPVVDATNHGVAVRRGYALAKAKIRRGSKVVTVRATALGSLTTVSQK